MTKTAESELIQLKAAILHLANQWEKKGNQIASYTRRAATTPEDFPESIGEVRVYWQASTALHLLLENVEVLSGDAADPLIKCAAIDASAKASDGREPLMW